MKNLSIARRYAKALLLIAKEDGQAEAYRTELQDFAELMAANKELENAVCNPLYEAESRRKVLSQIIAKLDVSRVMASFLTLLFDKGRIGFVPYINDFYQELADELKGLARASVVSAAELSSDAIEKIRVSLSKLVNKEVVLDVGQDPDLIGGVVTKIGDLVLDGSIKTQLINMRESLKKGEGV